MIGIENVRFGVAGETQEIMIEIVRESKLELITRGVGTGSNVANALLQHARAQLILRLRGADRAQQRDEREPENALAHRSSLLFYASRSGQAGSSPC
jgi:hypothetical protein